MKYVASNIILLCYLIKDINTCNMLLRFLYNKKSMFITLHIDKLIEMYFSLMEN